jgi:NAD(P)-dependent dehydrogenase (short-subunit alcohol dehydrogenase family)
MARDLRQAGRIAHTRVQQTTGKSLIDRVGARAVVVKGDVRLDEDCARAIQSTADTFGSLDILLNNAGVARPGDVLSVSDEDWNLTVDVNLKGTMLLSRAASRIMKDRGGGSIINVSSLAAFHAFGSVAYAASKGGLISMTRDMAFALGPFGIRVNCLIPGFLATPIGGAHDPCRREQRRLATFLGIEGSAWDLAWAALFFASDESRWITAASLNVDAGTSAASNLPGIARTK